ncbi:hypothetical protein M3Y95_01030900 [Aphelenchoides besseyi]|nr:hypothetical protein M3Y95_01030900 [Aphelenchoides besseyi]
MLLFLLLVPLVHSYGNNKCIQRYLQGSQSGFNLTNCRDAEIAVQWSVNRFFNIHYKRKSIPDIVKFKMILNDQCELNFVGREEEDRTWRLRNEQSQVFCTRLYCELFVMSTGELVSGMNDQPIGCVGNNLVNHADDKMWTKIRVQVEDQYQPTEFLVYVVSTSLNAGEEYEPSTDYSVVVVIFFGLVVISILVGVFLYVHSRFPFFWRNLLHL